MRIKKNKYASFKFRSLITYLFFHAMKIFMGETDKTCMEVVTPIVMFIEPLGYEVIEAQIN